MELTNSFTRVLGGFIWHAICCVAYYRRITCFGTGDCTMSTLRGGHVDDQSRWASECNDGEALIGFYDGGEYTSISDMWCKFMFPKKKPSFGIYPFYEFCNVRDIDVMNEYYCYDKLYPTDTYDTFVTAFTPSVSYGGTRRNGELYKCCKLPHGYHLDYSRCTYLYTHDKQGEHYNDNFMYLTKCPRDHLMTGMGKAENPWDGAMHYVWIQCCPLFFDSSYRTFTDINYEKPGKLFRPKGYLNETKKQE